MKKTFTALAAALPMLLTPYALYLWLGFPPQETMLFLRLYGLSTMALLVGYHGGIELARRGEFPRTALRVGLVSNGGQGLALLVAGLAGTYAAWGWMARAMMWGLCLFILGIAVLIARWLLLASHCAFLTRNAASIGMSTDPRQSAPLALRAARTGSAVAART